jgi:MerR family transcriptional regulator, copper efflux regulator
MLAAVRVRGGGPTTVRGRVRRERLRSLPLACSLSAHDTTARVEEWRGLLNGRVVETVRAERAVRLRLQDGDDAVLVAIDLARREKACCAFFEFRLVLLPEAVWLEIDAPDEAAPILDAMISVGVA